MTISGHVKMVVLFGVFCLALPARWEDAVPGTAGTEERNPEIAVLLYNYAEVPGPILGRAEKSAARVFRRAGIDIGWGAGPLVPSEVGSERPSAPRLYLRILPQSMSAHFPVDSRCLGFAQSLAPPIANVFFHQVQEVVRDRTMDPALVLGHLIAHEIGHLLLGKNAHSHTGIMSIPWTLQHVESAARGQLLFSRQQAATMRANVRRSPNSEKQF